MPFWVYMVECRDGTLYTGFTTDLTRRVSAHNSGKGAKYTRSRLPVRLVYSEECPDKSSALRREYAVKHLTRGEKLALLSRGPAKEGDTMEKKPTRLDIHGNPLPERPKKPSAQKPKAKTAPAKKKPSAKPETPKSRYLQDWYFLHEEEYTADMLKDIFVQDASLDVETWPALGVLEVTFPDKSYIDFERTEAVPEEECIAALAPGKKSIWFVTADPVCDEAQLAFLKEIAARTGGIIAAEQPDGTAQILR